MSSTTKKIDAPKVTTISELMDLVSSELDTIARDIEALPMPCMENMTSEDVMNMQKIDFSNQKLRDFASLLQHVGQLQSSGNQVDKSDLEGCVNLEYSKQLMTGS